MERFMSITLDKLNSLLNKDIHSCQLIDVREPYEFDEGSIPGSINMPMGSVLEFLGKEKYKSIREKRFIIFYCKSGRRSAAVNYMVRKTHKILNTYSLEGGYINYCKI